MTGNGLSYPSVALWPARRACGEQAGWWCGRRAASTHWAPGQPRHPLSSAPVTEGGLSPALGGSHSLPPTHLYSSCLRIILPAVLKATHALPCLCSVPQPPHLILPDLLAGQDQTPFSCLIHRLLLTLLYMNAFPKSHKTHYFPQKTEFLRGFLLRLLSKSELVAHSPWEVLASFQRRQGESAKESTKTEGIYTATSSLYLMLCSTCSKKGITHVSLQPSLFLGWVEISRCLLVTSQVTSSWHMLEQHSSPTVFFTAKSAFLDKQNENCSHGTSYRLKNSSPRVERMELTYFIWLYLSKETELLAKLAHLWSC